jgi:hypothetical protein
VGLAIETLVIDANTSSHPSIKATNSRPVHYNKNILKKSGSMGTLKRLQSVLVLEQFVNKCRRLGASLAHKGHKAVS